MYYNELRCACDVNTGLDTLQQIESHLLMRHYDGLMKSGRIKGRSNVGAA